MTQLIPVVIWPLAVLFFAIFFILIFRQQVAALIDRTKKVGKGGIETFESLPSQPSAEKKGVEEYFRNFENPLLLDAERAIHEDLRNRGIEEPKDREKTLIRALASNNLILYFERISSVIWASQVACLRHLNTHDQGSEKAEIVVFYETAKSGNSMISKNVPFEEWLGFLLTFNLVVTTETRYYITERGRGLLQYFVATGKSDPYYG